MKWTSTSPEETMALGRQLIQKFPEHSVICLNGDLGSGKTHFAKGIGSALNIPERQVKSPTFTLIFEHQGNDDRKMIHCDFYRFETAQDFQLEWWEEILNQPNSIVVLEWSQRIKDHLPNPRIDITFKRTGEQSREIIIQTR